MYNVVFFLCGRSRLCATLSLGSRKDAVIAKQENRFIHCLNSRNTTLFNSLYLKSEWFITSGSPLITINSSNCIEDVSQSSSFDLEHGYEK